MSLDLKQRRVLNQENQEDILIVDSDEENKEKIKRDRTDEFKKSEAESPLSLTNITWFVFAVIVVYYSNIFNVILFEEKINRYFFYFNFYISIYFFVFWVF